MATVLFVGSSAGAGTSRGRNGQIAFISVRASGSFELYTMRADGSHPRRLTRNPPEAGYAAWSPDGRRIAFINVGLGQLWLMRADGRQRRPLVQRIDACCASPTWSPDGKRIAFVRRADFGDSGGLWVVDTQGRRLRRLTKREDYSPAWRPDGKRIAFVRGRHADVAGGDIFTISPRGGNATRLMRTPGVSERHLSWARDGRLAFEALRGEELEDLFVMNADGSGRRNVTTTPDAREYSADWSPDGKELLYCDFNRGGRLFILDIERRKSREFVTDTEYCGDPDWSPDGSRILFHEYGEVRSLALPGGKVTPVVEGRSDSSPAWSPDGRLVAFSRNGSIYIIPLGAGQLARVGPGSEPSWSPDGRTLAVNAAGDPGGIDTVRADGAGRRRILSDGADEDTAYGDPAWSPDGTRLAFHSRYWRTTPADNGVCILRVRTPARRHCVASGAAPSWSPDGRLLVYECDHYDGPHGICTIQPDGKRKRRLSTRGRGPRFSPDGRRIVYDVSTGRDYSGGPGATSDVYVMNADGSGRRRLTRSRGHDFDPDWQPLRK